MKDKKCKLTIEFQAEDDEILKCAVCRLSMSVSGITKVLDVTATEYIPDKYDPYAKS